MRALDAERPCGARHVPVRLLQRLDDALAFGSITDGMQARLLLPLRRPYLQRYRRDGDAIVRRQNRHALDHVPELAYVPRPVVFRQHVNDVGVQRLGTEVVARAVLGEKVRRELAEVLNALAQRRYMQRDDAEAVVEIAPEASPGHQRL